MLDGAPLAPPWGCSQLALGCAPVLQWRRRGAGGQPGPGHLRPERQATEDSERTLRQGTDGHWKQPSCSAWRLTTSETGAPRRALEKPSDAELGGRGCMCVRVILSK